MPPRCEITKQGGTLTGQTIFWTFVIFPAATIQSTSLISMLGPRGALEMIPNLGLQLRMIAEHEWFHEEIDCP
jgi:hypothetical protein